METQWHTITLTVYPFNMPLYLVYARILLYLFVQNSYYNSYMFRLNRMNGNDF